MGDYEKKNTPLPAFGLAEDILGKAAAPTPAPEINSDPVRASSMIASAKDQSKYVTFKIGREEYGLAISQVQEINRVFEITRVPNSPAHVKGVINLRGRIIPVLDLAAKLGIASTAAVGKESRIVVVENGAKALGLMVDSVSHVMTIEADQIEKPPEEAIDLERNHIKGVGKIGDRMIIVLDLEKVLQKENAG